MKLESKAIVAATVMSIGIGAATAADDLQWLSTTYDFGVIKEIEGKKTGTVKGVNRGDAPAMINRVRLSCGCTNESHTEDPIAPGDTATVSFTYNPVGRPGPFKKTVKIYSGSDNRLTTITMTGTVIGAPETLSTTYPIEVGPLRIGQKVIDLGKVRYGSSRHCFLNGYNQSSDSIRPTWGKTPGPIDFSISSHAIPPGDISTFSIYLNGREIKEMGPMEYQIDLTPDKGSQDKVTLTVLAEIEPDTSGLTPEQVANGPRCALIPRNIDLGMISGNNPMRFRFTISNEGKSAMRVSRVKARTKSIIIKRIPVNVKAGKSGDAEGTLSIANLPTGPFRIPIEVYTDDPLHPVSTINVVGIKE